MKQTYTVYLEAELQKDAAAAAKKMDRNFSWLVTQALSQLLYHPKKKRGKDSV